MDYFDMAESLRKKKFEGAAVESLTPGYYDGCTKIDHEFDEIKNVMGKGTSLADFQKIHRPGRDGIRPRIQEFVEIANSMSQGSGAGFVRQM
jgi:hypothetical protein